MLRAIQAEFMKLFTLRYVYIVTGIMAVVALLASYIIATINGPSADIPTTNTILASAVQVTLWLYVSVLAVIAALSVANEYRHNTMTYTIITVNSRIKVYLAKVVVIVVFALHLQAVHHRQFYRQEVRIYLRLFRDHCCASAAIPYSLH